MPPSAAGVVRSIWVTPPPIEFSGHAVSEADDPHLQHPNELQIIKGGKVVLKWSIGTPFTNGSLDADPAGYGPVAINGANGMSDAITVDNDVAFRLRFEANGKVWEKFINVHTNDPKEEVSAVANLHHEGEDGADKADVEDDALLNCDLCIFAYQLYHQSLVWPLDPWYEVLARGATSRRSHFMEQIHEYAKTLPPRVNYLYGGPAVVGGLGSSNAALDPVLTAYGNIRPRDPAITGDGAVYMALRAPPYIVDSISKVSVAHYTGAVSAEWPHGPTVVRGIYDYGEGTDELVAFEGGTGTLDANEAAYSLMGCVLQRARKDGGWDAHIVFRGSRSGNAVRAAMKGLQGKGNADWVTDTASVLVTDPYYDGSVHKGFGASLKRCMGPIRAALLYLDQKHGAPKSIQIAGHSLGAALASLCMSGMMEGVPGKRLSAELPAWPFDTVRGYFMALPPSGSEGHAAQFNKRAAGRTIAPYVAGDMVVENSASVASADRSKTAGMVKLMGSGGCSLGKLLRMPRVAGATDLDNSHEITLIRAGLVDRRGAAKKPPADAIKNATPWGYYLNFTDMLEGKPINFVRGEKPVIVTRENLRKVLSNYRFAAHFRPFLSKLKDVVGDPKSYRGFHREESYQQAAERFQLAAEMAATPIDSKDAKVIADNVATQAAMLFGFEAKTELVRKGWKVVKQAAKDAKGGVGLEGDELVGEDFGARIGLGLVLAAFEENEQTTLDHFLAAPELKLCLEAVLGDASTGQKEAAASGGRAK